MSKKDSKSTRHSHTKNGKLVTSISIDRDVIATLRSAAAIRANKFGGRISVSAVVEDLILLYLEKLVVAYDEMELDN